MNLNEKAIEYIPENAKKGNKVNLCISAHQDDIEIMAYHGIIDAYNSADKVFVACVTTDGAGSARTGKYACFTDDDMKQIRVEEQKNAAEIGHYSKLYLLNYTSSNVKDKDNLDIIDDYIEIIREHKPEVIYTHNLADKHDTHIGVVTKVIKAIRKLNKEERPTKLYGCEVWRDLDWLSDSEKVLLDVSSNPKLANDLLTVFDSQIAGGKRYDLATAGRRLANATYAESHSVDNISAISNAMDLTPLIENDDLDVIEFIINKIEEFKNDVKNKISKVY